MDLSTTYMGFHLKNPIIVASSGLTADVSGVKECEKQGAAAVVLRSLFEEQIKTRFRDRLPDGKPENAAYPEADEYIAHHSGEHSVNEYLELIRSCKGSVKIPVIASINCISFSEWINFAVEIEKAGADGLELNMSILPSDTQRTCLQVEELYLEILNEVVKKLSIPVGIKIGPNFSSLSKSALRFSFTGIKGMVLFNRFFSPDIDIENLSIIPGPLYSSPSDLNIPLRWIALLSERVYCDIAASTGIHDGEALVKVLLAGAKAAEICSVLYQQGFGQIRVMLEFLEQYLKRHDFSSPEEIIGMMSMRKSENPAAFERVQFMKYFSEIK